MCVMLCDVRTCRGAPCCTMLCHPDACRFVKQLKMEILTLLACPSNVYEIVSELTEYARDINPEIARQAVKAVGRIALTVRADQCGAQV